MEPDAISAEPPSISETEAFGLSRTQLLVRFTVCNCIVQRFAVKPVKKCILCLCFGGKYFIKDKKIDMKQVLNKHNDF